MDRNILIAAVMDEKLGPSPETVQRELPAGVANRLGDVGVPFQELDVPTPPTESGLTSMENDTLRSQNAALRSENAALRDALRDALLSVNDDDDDDDDDDDYDDDDDDDGAAALIVAPPLNLDAIPTSDFTLSNMNSRNQQKKMPGGYYRYGKAANAMSRTNVNVNAYLPRNCRVVSLSDPRSSIEIKKDVGLAFDRIQNRGKMDGSGEGDFGCVITMTPVFSDKGRVSQSVAFTIAKKYVRNLLEVLKAKRLRSDYEQMLASHFWKDSKCVSPGESRKTAIEEAPMLVEFLRRHEKEENFKKPYVGESMESIKTRVDDIYKLLVRPDVLVRPDIRSIMKEFVGVWPWLTGHTGFLPQSPQPQSSPQAPLQRPQMPQPQRPQIPQCVAAAAAAAVGTTSNDNDIPPAAAGGGDGSGTYAGSAATVHG